MFRKRHNSYVLGTLITLKSYSFDPHDTFWKLISVVRKWKRFICSWCREIPAVRSCTAVFKLGSCPGALSVRVLDFQECTREYPLYGTG